MSRFPESALTPLCSGIRLYSAERRIADCILADVKWAATATSAELARGSGASEATVTRLCHKLGFENFRKFQLALARDVMEQQEAEKRHPSAPVSRQKTKLDTTLQRILLNKQEEVRATLQALEPAVQGPALAWLLHLLNNPPDQFFCPDMSHFCLHIQYDPVDRHILKYIHNICRDHIISPLQICRSLRHLCQSNCPTCTDPQFCPFILSSINPVTSANDFCWRIKYFPLFPPIAFVTVIMIPITTTARIVKIGLNTNIEINVTMIVKNDINA